MAEGTVTWFDADRGFGFITPDDGTPEVFVHYTAIEADGFRCLREGERVVYEVSQGRLGPQASDVRVIRLVAGA